MDGGRTDVRVAQGDPPADLATHSTEQILYVGTNGLLHRRDYNVDISGATTVRGRRSRLARNVLAGALTPIAPMGTHDWSRHRRRFVPDRRRSVGDGVDLFRARAEAPANPRSIALTCCSVSRQLPSIFSVCRCLT